ncbi:MAG: bifunctional histidinol-phosphatase/imidazoleglycerol-phosphate dehydratase [Bacteroidetes bacterium]|nr:MAG: bifunctional histidinol-phosphatase/imidazoleglycerol-phosphate dehydratase [Bacteroidota bacterium]PTM12928.1 MAG: bifunctional histidinol-phosphatase/imidazoleglycerol-phosphate dehydratase [Bacteroidota bacterium]
MQKILFLDRDGTLNLEPADYQVDALDKVAFYPRVFEYLGRIARELDYRLVMVTNQDGLGTDSFPEEAFWPAQNLIVNTLAGEGIVFDEIVIDRTFAHENLPTRKPGTDLLRHYLTGDYDLANSYVIGDRLTDMQLARNLGARGIWINNEPDLGVDELQQAERASLQDTILLTTNDWADIYALLKLGSRQAMVHRQTKETDIRVELNLDGTGQSQMQTGLGFFDHMLDQLARHSGCDLSVQVTGDLHIDEHHTIEDTALALGEAFAQALGNKLGIERYGFYLPMDDALAQVAIDFGGRPWLVWDATYTREKIGDMPTEMFFHFFKSFTDAARCNLNIKVTGDNEHHKIEATFKGLAKAIRMAKTRDAREARLPSTKGVL